MALIPLQKANLNASGLLLAYTAVSASDTLAPANNAALHIKNGSGVSTTVTIVDPGTTPQAGVANPDPTFTVAAGAERVIGPIPSGWADPATGVVTFTTTPTTTITCAWVQNP